MTGEIPSTDWGWEDERLPQLEWSEDLDSLGEIYPFSDEEALWRDLESLYDVLARWQIYKHAEQKVDPVKDVIKKMHKLGLKKYHTVADFGCGSADMLVDLRLLHEHSGRLVGIDMNPDLFMPAEVLLHDEQAAPIDFLTGDVQNLSGLQSSSGESIIIDDESLDAASALFFLYYPEDPLSTLMGIAAKVRRGGLLVASTTGSGNKATQRKDEAEAAKYISEHFLKTSPPPRFNSRFDRAIAQKALSSLPGFKIVDEIRQRTVANVTHEGSGDGSYDDYLGSFEAMRRSFWPYPDTESWRSAINHAVRPAMNRRIRKKGQMRVEIDRQWWFLRKN